MSDREAAIIGLRREIKTVRTTARDLKDQITRWRKVCSTLRGLSGLDEAQFRNLLKAESLPVE